MISSSDKTTCQPLDGFRIVSLAVNLPGPLAASRLHQMGAAVTKIEPPAGDPFLRYCPEWYECMRRGQTVLSLNLKDINNHEKLSNLVSNADLLITSNRPAALSRLGLDWPSLHTSFPRLSQVAILGHNHPDENRSGHDLTYQAYTGLITPPHMPRTLLTDLACAERVVSIALALLLCAQRGREGKYAEIALTEAAYDFGAPFRYGLTTPGGLLGGGFPGYNLYRTTDGWIALAALEPHFWERCVQQLDLEYNAEYEDLARVFADQSTAYWVTFAKEQDIPIVAIG